MRIGCGGALELDAPEAGMPEPGVPEMSVAVVMGWQAFDVQSGTSMPQSGTPV